MIVCQDYATLVYSLLGIKTTFALISSYSTPFELSSSFKLCTVTHLFVSKNLLPRVLAATKQGGPPPENIYLLDGYDTRHKSFPDLIDNVKRNGSPKVPIRPAKHETLAYLAASSGTTGLPKGWCGFRTRQLILIRLYGSGDGYSWEYHVRHYADRHH